MLFKCVVEDSGSKSVFLSYLNYKICFNFFKIDGNPRLTAIPKMCQQCLSCGLWTGPRARKVLFDGGPAQGGAAPPASSTVTTLFTSHKQASQTPKSEAALCHCYGREVQTNSHIQNDMINQLAAREDRK